MVQPAFRLGAVLMLGIAANAQAASQSRELIGFSSITVGDGIKLEVEQGPGFAVVVSSDRSALQDVVTNLEGRHLTIGLRTREGSPDHRDEAYRVKVTLPALMWLSAGSGSEVVLKGMWTATHLGLAVSGAGRLRMHGNVAELQVEAQNGSVVVLGGTVTALRVQSSGGSRVDTEALIAERADADASGGATIHLTATREVSADARGGSAIRILGTAQPRRLRAHGGSNIYRE